MIYTVTLNPAIDKTVYVDRLVVNDLNRVKESHQNVGGKGINVSKTLKVLNTDSVAMGIVAGATGDYIISNLTKENIICNFQKVNGLTRTNLKIVDDNRGLTEVNEPGPFVSDNDINKFTNDLLKLVVENDVIVLSGSVTTNINKDIYYNLITALNKCGCRVIMDADGELFAQGIKAIPTLVKPNSYELCQYFNIQKTDDIATLTILAKKIIVMGIKYVVISMGSLGALFFSEENSYKALALTVDVGSTVGAGDAMVAGLTKALSENMDYEEMIKLAVATSAGAVTTKGTESASLSVINDLKKQVKLIKM